MTRDNLFVNLEEIFAGELDNCKLNMLIEWADSYAEAEAERQIAKHVYTPPAGVTVESLAEIGWEAFRVNGGGGTLWDNAKREAQHAQFAEVRAILSELDIAAPEKLDAMDAMKEAMEPIMAVYDGNCSDHFQALIDAASVVLQEHES